MSTDPYRSIFLGGPCDGLEQTSTQPPPQPEWPQQRWGNRIAVYRLSSVQDGVHRYVFVEYREQPSEGIT